MAHRVIGLVVLCVFLAGCVRLTFAPRPVFGQLESSTETLGGYVQHIDAGEEDVGLISSLGPRCTAKLKGEKIYAKRRIWEPVKYDHGPLEGYINCTDGRRGKIRGESGRFPDGWNDMVISGDLNGVGFSVKTKGYWK